MTSRRLSPRAARDLLGEWRDARPLHVALAARIQLLVLDGRLSSDVVLPAERELATAVGVSRTTVTGAYRQLRESGFAHSRVGSGTTTALPDPAATPDDASSGPLDLRRAAFPATLLLPSALANAAIDVTPLLGTSGYETVGLPDLRRAVAEHYTARGLPTSPTEVLITTSAQSAIAIAIRVFSDRGDRIYAESPSYPNAYDAVLAAGGRLVTSPVSPDDGWDIDALETVFRRSSPALGYLMPDFHNPTGRSMTADDRERLLRAAAATGTILLIDDTTAELAIDRSEAWLPLATSAEGSGATVVHLGSASKIFWGGLRIGWIRASEHLVQRLAAARSSSDLASPILDQLVVARLMPRIDEVLSERKGQLIGGRAAVSAALVRHVSTWTMPSTLDGGLAAWVNLGSAASSQLAHAVRSQGVLINAGSRFGVDGAFETYLRIPLTLDASTLAQAFRVFGDVWPRVAGSSRRLDDSDTAVV